MKPVQIILLRFSFCTMALLLWPTCPRAEAQPVHGDRETLPRVEEERPLDVPSDDPMAGPRADQPGRPDGRGHRCGLRDGEGPRFRGPRSGEMRPPGPRWEGPDKMQDFLSEKERKELLAFTKEHFPKMYELLSGARGELRDRMFRRVGWPMLRLLRLHRHDPELAEKLIAEHKIEMELAQLKRDYQEFPSESARESIKQKMRALLEQRFALRQQRLELEIQALEKRLVDARKRLDRQEADRQRLVDMEVERVIDQLQDKRMWGSALPSLGEESNHPGRPLDPPEPRERR